MKLYVLFCVNYDYMLYTGLSRANAMSESKVLGRNVQIIQRRFNDEVNGDQCTLPEGNVFVIEKFRL